MAQTVLITGASQGIGKTTALELARHGYDVVLAARELKRLSAAATEVRTLGRQALAIPTDVRDRQQVEDLVHKAIAFFEQIDVLVGTASFWTTAFHFAPGLMKPLIRRVFEMRDAAFDRRYQ